MNPILRNTIAVITGIILGGVANMAIITISGSVIPPPEGTDLTTVEGLLAAQDLMQPKHFLMPFLAHAIGTFVGGLFTGLIASKRKKFLAFMIGLFFLAGGIYAATIIPAPGWFIGVDLVFAYLPLAFLAGRLVSRKKS